MLKIKNLPSFLWGEGISTAAYTLNRSPTKRLIDISPKEAWTRTKPSVTRLRIFGTICYKHVLDQLRRKHDDKGMPHILVGYHSTGDYKLYDPGSGQVSISRDVICDENGSWNWNSTSSESQSRILLEEETPSTAPIANKVPDIRRSSRISQLPLPLRDYELFQDSEVNSEGKLVYFALITEVEPIEFDKAVTNEMWLKARG